MKKTAIFLLALLFVLPLSGCNLTRGGTTSRGGGGGMGHLGDTMSTYFFDFTVNSAYVCSEFEGYTPAEGNSLLVSEVTVENTMNESIPMFDTDFQVQWNDDESDDAFSVPITNDGANVSDEQLPESYDLSIAESRTGLLIFEVPEGMVDFSISYLEVFDDDSEGDVYFVYFTAENTGTVTTESQVTV